MRGQVDMPALVIVTDQLGLNRELHEQRVQPRHRALGIASGGGGEDRRELFPEVLEHGQIAPGDRRRDAVAKCRGACRSRAERIRLAGSLDSGVGKANR